MLRRTAPKGRTYLFASCSVLLVQAGSDSLTCSGRCSDISVRTSRLGTNSVMLLNTENVRSLEALYVPETGLKKSANKVSETRP